MRGECPKNKNCLLEGWSLVVQASAARWVFWEPICISVPAGVVRGLRSALVNLFLKTLSMHLPFACGWFTWTMFDSTFVTCWGEMQQKRLLCYKQLTKKLLWVKHKFTHGFLVLNEAKCRLTISLILGCPSIRWTAENVVRTPLSDYWWTCGVDWGVVELSANFIWRFGHEISFSKNCASFADT